MSRMVQLAKRAVERGTYGIKFTAKESNTGAVVSAGSISLLSWWLTDLSGKAINGRSGVVVTNITNPYYLILSNEDLQITDKTRGENTRIVTVRGNYYSTLGDNLPFVYAVTFKVLNTVIVDIDLDVTTYDTIVTWDIS